MAAPSIRVMVVDASPIVRAGVRSMLDGIDGIDVVATADSPARAGQRCADLDVDVVVTSPAALAPVPASASTSAADGDGDRFGRPPGARVVVLADAVDDRLVQALSSSGIDACLHLATVNDHELASAVRGVVHGQATFSSEFLPDLVHRARDARYVGDLTARESDILALLAQGQTNDAIAEALGLAVGTVRIYVSGILSKLGTPNRTAAAVLAIQEGLVEVDASWSLTHSG